MRKNITFDMVKAWAQNAITERGEDFVYTGSAYQTEPGMCVNVCTIDDKVVGSCIVGKILLENVGVPAEFFSGILSSGYIANESNITTLRPRLEDSYGIKFTKKAGRFLGFVQSNQDMGDTWGDSFDQALGWCAEFPENW